MVDEDFSTSPELAAMEKEALQAALSVLTNNYESWISEQEARIGAEVVEHDEAARVALLRCKEISSCD